MRKHTCILLAIFLLCLTENAISQDVILKEDNTTILSKVFEVTSTEFKYKKWSNQEGPLYSINRSDVTSISYQNGNVEMFNNHVEITPAPQQTETYPAAQTPIVQIQPESQTTESPYSRSRVQFSLNGGVAIPLGKFGTTDSHFISAPFNFIFSDEFEIGYGAAKTGFNTNMRLHIPIYKHDKDIIGIPLKFNVLFNGLSDQEKKDMRTYYQSYSEFLNEQCGVNGFSYKVSKYPNYMNFSFMVGMDYTHCFSKAFGLFIEGNLGLNIASITNTVIYNNYGSTFIYYDPDINTNYYSEDINTIKYQAKADFTYEIGGGLFLFNHLSLGVFFTGFSPYLVSYTNSYTSNSINYEGTDVGFCQKLQVSALSIQLGVHF